MIAMTTSSSIRVKARLGGASSLRESLVIFSSFVAHRPSMSLPQFDASFEQFDEIALVCPG